MDVVDESKERKCLADKFNNLRQDVLHLTGIRVTTCSNAVEVTVYRKFSPDTIIIEEPAPSG